MNILHVSPRRNDTHPDRICEICDRPYQDHAYDKQFPLPPNLWESRTKPKYRYRRLCNGDLIEAE